LNPADPADIFIQEDISTSAQSAYTPAQKVSIPLLLFSARLLKQYKEETADSV
jgi:hypothetical protein